MSWSAGWFVVWAGLSLLAMAFGHHLGRRGATWTRITILAGVLLMVAWSWLIRHPSVAVRVIPVQVLSHIEGIASVPIFMLIVGVAWQHAKMARQRHVIIWATLLAITFFVKSGWWMVQSTPAVGFASQINMSQPVVRQSQDYSCVPAACATALNLLGIPTTEADMAYLTQTRPGTGSTTIRAMDGLQQRLVGTDIDVQLLEPGYAELRSLPMPAITPLEYEAGYRHMVTIIRVSASGVWLADPMEGPVYLTRATFEQVYRRQVLAFDRPKDREDRGSAHSPWRRQVPESVPD